MSPDAGHITRAACTRKETRSTLLSQSLAEEYRRRTPGQPNTLFGVNRKLGGTLWRSQSSVSQDVVPSSTMLLQTFEDTPREAALLIQKMYRGSVVRKRLTSLAIGPSDSEFAKAPASSDGSSGASFKTRAPAAARGGTNADERMDLFVLPDVGLDLQVMFHPGADTCKCIGNYVVRGPPQKLAVLHRAAYSSSRSSKSIASSSAVSSTKPLGKLASKSNTDTDRAFEGITSPFSPVTLPPEVKREAGIPEAATHFAFVYPLSGEAEKQLDRNIDLAENPWAFALLIGGFLYFGPDEDLLAVNALTIMPSPAVLHLVGPYPPNKDAMAAMSTQGRMCEVSLDGMHTAGFRRFGWVHPGEKPGGERVSDVVRCEHGCFVYDTEDDTAPLLFRLTGGEKIDPDAYDADGKLGRAMVGLRRSFIQSNRERQLKANSEASQKAFLREILWLAVALSLYLGIGTAVLVPAEGWAPLQSIYFICVTMSTVGCT